MPAAADDRLESWKEIAAYVGRGVRTVRRWEQEEGMPVHRHLHRVLGTVYASKAEIDAWRRSGPRRGVLAPPPAPADARAHVVKSIAVLPFANLSTDPENEYFADGLTDEVTADLSKILALRVISRTSSMTFKATTKDVRTIARELGVRYVVQGSVRRSGSRLRSCGCCAKRNVTATIRSCSRGWCTPAAIAASSSNRSRPTRRHGAWTRTSPPASSRRS